MSTKHGRTHQRPFNKMSPDGNLDTEIIDNNNPNNQYLVCKNLNNSILAKDIIIIVIVKSNVWLANKNLVQKMVERY